MPSPTGPNLFILLLYIFNTKGYLLFFQDYIPLSLSPGKMWRLKYTYGANISATGAEKRGGKALIQSMAIKQHHTGVLFSGASHGENKTLYKPAKN